jgi:hypothetical protein
MLSKPDSFNSPSESATVPVLENYIQPTLGHGLRVWWAYYWPTSLISIVILGFSTVLWRKAWENGMLSGCAVAWADRIMPFLVVYIVSVPTIRYVLGKSFRSFRVALLPRHLSSSAEVLPASFRRSIRVWWDGATFLLLLVLFWRHNQTTYKRRYAQWERSFFCQTG